MVYQKAYDKLSPEFQAEVDHTIEQVKKLRDAKQSGDGDNE